MHSSTVARGLLVSCCAWLTASSAMAAPPIPEGLMPGTRNNRVDVKRPAPAPTGPTTVLAGRLLYEDHRSTGALTRRVDLDGNTARVRRKRTDRRQDFLGADYMVVEVFERDTHKLLDRSCERLAFIGQAVVGPDGSFSVPVPERDACEPEASAPPQYLIQVSTRHCDDLLCVELGRTLTSTYTLWFGREQPLVLGPEGAGANTLLFSAAGAPGQNPHALAANHFAALADALQVIHVEQEVPFRLEEFGKVHVRFPSVWGPGRAPAPGVIDMNNQGWPKGNKMVHEYGHILQRRLWNGNYAGYPVPAQTWNGITHSGEEPFIALKEGWANFVTSYVSGRCFRPGFDTRDDLASVKRGTNGIQYPQNHRRALCDLVDGHEDHREGTAVGDRVQMSLIELWQLMDQVDDRIGTYQGHDPVTEGLDMCDVAEVYLETRGRDAEHVRDIYGVLETNDIWCPQITERFASLPPMVPGPVKASAAADARPGGEH